MVPIKSFEWLKTLDTGNAVIDAQHRELMEYLKKLAAFVGEGKGQEAHSTCQELRQLLDAHFASEEDILRNGEFPLLDNHLVSHLKTTGQFSNVFSSCLDVCKESRAGPCLVEIASIFLNHFHEDKKFKFFLQTAGLANNNH